MRITQLTSLSARTEEFSSDNLQIKNLEAWANLPERFQDALRQKYRNLIALYTVITRLAGGMRAEEKQRIFDLIPQTIDLDLVIEPQQRK